MIGLAAKNGICILGSKTNWLLGTAVALINFSLENGPTHNVIVAATRIALVQSTAFAYRA